MNWLFITFCMQLVISNWLVFKNILTPAEIGNSSFSMSFTNVIVFELYHYTNRIGILGI